jgi:hypothetical protein
MKEKFPSTKLQVVEIGGGYGGLCFWLSVLAPECIQTYEICDLKIVGTEPHKKKPEWLGAIICESSDGIIKVNVGSGFNDEHRKSYKEKDLLGKIVAIKYNARIKNKAGEESLFLPVFVELREDKDIADSTKEVK